MGFEDVLGASGRELWDAVHDARDVQPHFKALLLNACRIADRLDAIAAELLEHPLTVTLYDRSDNPINEVANPLLGEHRQQSLALRQILASMGIDKLEKSVVSEKSLQELLADMKAK